MKRTAYHPCAGNVIFYILIAVGLLAALSYTVAQSGRGGMDQLSKERAALLATDIIEYSNIIDTAFNQLLLRGCDLSEISFENSVVSNYVNPSAPSDKTCNIFHLNGGGINWQNLSSQAINQNDYRYNNYYFNATNNKHGTLTNASDLLLIAEINQETCVAINKALNLSPADPPEGDSNSYHYYHSAFTYKGVFGAAVAGIFPYANIGCFQDTSTGNPVSGKYFFFRVLVDR